MQSDTLRIFRMAKNLKQKTIADLLGMSQPNYNDLENGKTKLNNEAAEKLAAYYDVGKDVFLTDFKIYAANNRDYRRFHLGFFINWADDARGFYGDVEFDKEQGSNTSN